MLIITIYGGFVSQVRAFYLAYRLARKYNDKLVLDLSQYYTGYYQPYLLDALKIPNIEKIALKGNELQRVSEIGRIYHVEPEVIRNGDELETVYSSYNKENLYYIVNDCCEYDSFCGIHKEFFYRYTGNDEVTNDIISMIQCYGASPNFDFLKKSLADKKSVGIHIRLRDFIKVGWMVEKDFAFYRAAVQWYREHLETPVFYVFSDDIECARNILGNCEDIKYVKLCGGYIADIEELLCLAKCENRILTKKSNYSLLAALLAQKVWGNNGYTLIIEKMNLAEFAGSYEYVDNNYNKNQGCHRNEDLGKYVLLSSEEIATYESRFKLVTKEEKRKDSISIPDSCFDSYFFNEKEIWEKGREVYAKNENSVAYEEYPRILEYKFNQYMINRKKAAFLFLTFQTYSESVVSGMQHMAHYFAHLGHEVHFVGKRSNDINAGSKGVKGLPANPVQAQDMNSYYYGFQLYPYDELNRTNKYVEFSRQLQKNIGSSLVVIVRKINALPPKEEHEKYPIRYVFLDFTDPYEREKCDYTDEEMEYLYRNADMIITYSEDIYKKWSVEDGINVHYVDISKFYPSHIILNERMYSPLQMKRYEESLFGEIYKLLVG